MLYPPVKTCLLSLCAINLVACAYQPQLDMPEVQTPALAEISDAKNLAVTEQPQAEWWRGYGSQELNRLFDELDSRSLDLATARQRVVKARALLGQQEAANWPTLDAQLGHRTSRDLDNSTTANSHSLSFSAAYEVDLWGSRDAANYTAQLNLIAGQQEYQSLLLQLQASLAQSYFDFLALQERYAIALQNFDASKELLDLIQLRFDEGGASGIELNQQRNTWLSAQAAALSLSRALAISERALAILLGRENLHMTDVSASFSALEIPAVSLIQPAALLEYRPDIRLAESELRINEAALYQEKQKRWPSLRLSAGLGVDDIFSGGDAWLGTLVGSLAMPLFNAGRITQQIAAAETDLTIAQLGYRQVVIQAIAETLNTLTELEYQKQLQGIRQQELANNEQLYELAKLRYESGDTDFLNLLTAQRSWFNARDSLIAAKSDQLLATVNVFKAMGVTPIVADDELPDAP